MTRSELTRALQTHTGAIVITVSELSKALGYKDRHTAARFVRDLEPVPGTRKYLISEVAEEILRRKR